MADSPSRAEQEFFSRIASDFTTKAWVLIPVGVGINFVGGTLVNVLQLPIFLDTIGTILVARGYERSSSSARRIQPITLQG